MKTDSAEMDVHWTDERQAGSALTPEHLFLFGESICYMDYLF